MDNDPYFVSSSFFNSSLFYFSLHLQDTSVVKEITEINYVIDGRSILVHCSSSITVTLSIVIQSVYLSSDMYVDFQDKFFSL